MVEPDEIAAALAAWASAPLSLVGDHGDALCRRARTWFNALDKSLCAGATPFAGPRWIRERFRWGPSPWPLFWCEVPERKQLDCGALAAMSREVFLDRGVACAPVQLIQRFSLSDSLHWNRKWSDAGDRADWIRGSLVYHEGCAVSGRDDQVSVWDPTDNFWIDSDQRSGYGATLAIRLVRVPGFTPSVSWGEHQLRMNAWLRLEP